MNALTTMLPAFVTRDPLPYAFCFLMLFGFMLPICEEMAVALVGVTMKATDTHFLLAVSVALAALLIQDTGYFFAARLFGARLIRHRLLARIIKPRASKRASDTSLGAGPLSCSRRDSSWD